MAALAINLHPFHLCFSFKTPNQVGLIPYLVNWEFTIPCNWLFKKNDAATIYSELYNEGPMQ